MGQTRQDIRRDCDIVSSELDDVVADFELFVEGGCVVSG